MELRGLCALGSDRDKLRYIGWFLSFYFCGNNCRHRPEEREPNRDGVPADFPARPRFPTGAEVLDVGGALDSQAGPEVLGAFAHEAGQQRRFVTWLCYAFGLCD